MITEYAIQFDATRVGIWEDMEYQDTLDGAKDAVDIYRDMNWNQVYRIVKRHTTIVEEEIDY